MAPRCIRPFWVFVAHFAPPLLEARAVHLADSEVDLRGALSLDAIHSSIHSGVLTA